MLSVAIIGFTKLFGWRRKKKEGALGSIGTYMVLSYSHFHSSLRETNHSVCLSLFTLKPTAGASFLTICNIDPCVCLLLLQLLLSLYSSLLMNSDFQYFRVSLEPEVGIIAMESSHGKSIKSIREWESEVRVQSDIFGKYSFIKETQQQGLQHIHIPSISSLSPWYQMMFGYILSHLLTTMLTSEPVTPHSFSSIWPGSHSQ